MKEEKSNNITVYCIFFRVFRKHKIIFLLQVVHLRVHVVHLCVHVVHLCFLTFYVYVCCFLSVKLRGNIRFSVNWIIIFRLGSQNRFQLLRTDLQKLYALPAFSFDMQGLSLGGPLIHFFMKKFILNTLYYKFIKKIWNFLFLKTYTYFHVL